MEKQEGKIEELIKSEVAVAYCAGHFDQEKRRYAYGVIIIDDENKEHKICGSGMNQKYLDAQNIAGEIFGVLNAMDWAVSNGFTKLMIYSQTEQIGKWLTGELKEESRAAKMLRFIYETKYAEILQSEIQSVETSSEFREKSEDLAKKPLTEGKRISVSGDNWFVVDDMETEKIQSIIKIMKSEMEPLETEEIDEVNKLSYNLTFANQKLAVTLFKSARQKLLVRGKDSILFQLFVTYLNEHAEITIEKVLSDAYRKRIDSLVLDQQVAVFFPTLPPTFPKAAMRLIRQAVINLTYFSVGDEYLQYALPVTNAMEVWLTANSEKAEVSKVLKEYSHRIFGKEGPRRKSLEILGEQVSTNGIAKKVDADILIQKTLSDLNELVFITK